MANERRMDKLMSGTGVSIKLTEDRTVIKEFLGLVYNRYCLDMGWMNPEDYPEGVIKDKFDNHGSFVIILKDGKIIGGTRLVRDSESGFPHEYAVGGRLPDIAGQADFLVKERLKDIGRDRIVEVTKTISISPKNMITKDLVKSFFWFGKRRGIHAYYIVIDMAFFLLCQKICVPIHPIGTPGFIDGSWSLPGVIFTDEIGPHLSEKNPDFFGYVSKADNLEGDWGV